LPQNLVGAKGLPCPALAHTHAFNPRIGKWAYDCVVFRRCK
jgi:hypothetical protein